MSDMLQLVVSDTLLSRLYVDSLTSELSPPHHNGKLKHIGHDKLKRVELWFVDCFAVQIEV
jgi:hypothetical protein